MTKQEIKNEEIKDRSDLAKKFHKAALYWNNQSQFRRMMIDLGYNGAELATKGLILLKDDMLPSRHSGIVRRFSELYIKTEIIEKTIGRNFHICLDLRNKARYVARVELTKKEGELVLNTAKYLINYLAENLKTIYQ